MYLSITVVWEKGWVWAGRNPTMGYYQEAECAAIASGDSGVGQATKARQNPHPH